MQRLVVHKVGVGSLAKLYGVWAAIVGIVVGVIAAVVTTVSLFQNNDFGVFSGLGVAVGVSLGWIVVYPFVMYLFGWLQGAVIAVVFNMVISGSGGLSVEVEETAISNKK